eukprot:COSAG06_NODE_1920_length_8063_cov_14.050854_6_plen_82_part_00
MKYCQNRFEWRGVLLCTSDQSEAPQIFDCCVRVLYRTCQLAVLLSAVLGLIGDVIGRDLQEEARKRINSISIRSHLPLRWI